MIYDLRDSIYSTGNKVIGQVGVDMRLLINYGKRVAFLACALEHDVRKRNMENLNGMYSYIYILKKELYYVS